AAGPANCEEQTVIIDQTSAAEDLTGIQFKVLNLIAHAAPVQNALVVRRELVNRAVERNRLPRPGVEHPGHVIRAASGVTRGARTPTLAGHPVLWPTAGEE